MFAILLICALTVEEVNRAPAVGMVLAVEATILDRDGKKARGLEVGDVLHPGEKLSVDSKGEAILYFFSKEGHRERLKPGAHVVVGELGCSPPDAIERLKAPPLSQTNTKNLHELIQGQESAVGILRGNPTTDPPVVTPIYGASVLTDRPSFRWLATDGADEYEFVLLSAANGDGEEVLWNATTREPRLEYPVKESPLLPGQTYHWRVTPLSKANKDRKTITGKISTLTRSELEELSQLDRLIAGSDPQVLLLAAVLFDAHDVSDKALILYERLAKLAPEQANLQVALAGYYRLAGRLPEAEAAEDRAKKLRQTVP